MFCKLINNFCERHSLVLGLEIQRHSCFEFLQLPSTPPFLRLPREESTRRAAIFTVKSTKQAQGEKGLRG